MPSSYPSQSLPERLHYHVLLLGTWHWHSWYTIFYHRPATHHIAHIEVKIIKEKHSCVFIQNYKLNVEAWTTLSTYICLTVVCHGGFHDQNQAPINEAKRIGDFGPKTFVSADKFKNKQITKRKLSINAVNNFEVKCYLPFNYHWSFVLSAWKFNKAPQNFWFADSIYNFMDDCWDSRLSWTGFRTSPNIFLVRPRSEPPQGAEDLDKERHDHMICKEHYLNILHNLVLEDPLY